MVSGEASGTAADSHRASYHCTGSLLHYGAGGIGGLQEDRQDHEMRVCSLEMRSMEEGFLEKVRFQAAHLSSAFIEGRHQSKLCYLSNYRGQSEAHVRAAARCYAPFARPTKVALHCR